MDEVTSLTISPWQPLLIGNEDFVYRQVHVQALLKLPASKKRRYPNETHFVPDPDGLSVYWKKQIELKNVFITIGLSYKFNTNEFKDHTLFKVFEFPVAFIKTIEGISQVLHAPVFNGDPAPVGYPNIFSHSLVAYENDPEIRLKLSDYCRDNNNSSFCDFDVHSIDNEVGKLRDKLNDTPFHKVA